MAIVKYGKSRWKQKKKKKKKPALFHSEGQVGVSHQILYGQKSPIL